MNRRNFLTRLLTGTAALAVATPCGCALRSFWEGPCSPACAAELMKPTYGQYVDYTNFSEFALKASFDDMIQNCATELGRQAGLDIKALYATAFDHV